MTNSDARTATASPRDILITARKLIEKPENWCQGAFFHNDAQCATGAIARTMDVPVHKAIYSPPYMALQKVVGCIAEFNDSVSHAEVLAAFDRAIEQCAVGDREGDAAGSESA